MASVVRGTSSAARTANRFWTRANTVRVVLVVVCFIILLNRVTNFVIVSRRVRKRVLRPGEPAASSDPRSSQPAANSIVTVHYRGFIVNTGREFDSSYKRGKPFTFELGIGQVIPCWDRAISSMHRGELARIYCDPSEAYGERGIPGVIPPSAALEFEVELLDFVPST
jgi:FKBP-type peptidyl-prolyl cis-trans isomerase FkpA